MAAPQVYTGISPVPGLPAIQQKIFTQNVFIQKLFPSARFVPSWARRTTNGNTTIYTVPTGKIFLLIYTTNSISGDSTGFGGVSLNFYSEGKTYTISSCEHNANIAGEQSQVIVFPAPVAFFAGDYFILGQNTDSIDSSCIVGGFEVDQYEWDRYVTPQ